MTRERYVSSWEELKLFVERSTSFSSDSLHVVASVVILIAAALIMKRPLSSWRPWLLLLGFAGVNELVDLWADQWPHPGMQYGEGARDLLLTMAVPTVLLLSTRHLPRLYEPRRPVVRTDDPGMPEDEPSSTSRPL